MHPYIKRYSGQFFMPIVYGPYSMEISHEFKQIKRRLDTIKIKLNRRASNCEFGVLIFDKSASQPTRY